MILLLSDTHFFIKLIKRTKEEFRNRYGENPGERRNREESGDSIGGECHLSNGGGLPSMESERGYGSQVGVDEEGHESVSFYTSVFRNVSRLQKAFTLFKI